MSARGSANTGVTSDVLFVGLTRPAMAFGVTYAALLANAVITVEAFLLSRNLLALLACAPIHGLCTLACRSDARFFELWADWARRSLVHRFANAAYFRSRTLSPLRSASEPWVRP